MDLKEAQDLILLAVENPKANVPAERLALAVATVLVRTGLLEAYLSQVTLNVVTTDKVIDWSTEG